MLRRKNSRNSKDISLKNLLSFTPLRNGCLINFTKGVHGTEKNYKLLIRNFNSTFKTTGFFYINVRGKWRCTSLCFITWLASLGVCIYLECLFDIVRNKLQAINIYWSYQKKIKISRKEHTMWTCFKFWPMKNIFRKL